MVTPAVYAAVAAVVAGLTVCCSDRSFLRRLCGTVCRPAASGKVEAVYLFCTAGPNEKTLNGLRSKYKNVSEHRPKPGLADKRYPVSQRTLKGRAKLRRGTEKEESPLCKS